MRRLSAGIWLCGAVAILAILLLLLRACAPVNRCIDKPAARASPQMIEGVT